jgi:hypothetical protein
MRAWQKLDLLCRAGVNLVHSAPLITKCLREAVGADAASLFWLDADGAPAGVYHESAAPAVLDLFINEYDRLFSGASEINVSQIAAATGRPVGVLYRPDAEYFRSNTFNLLLRPSGHHHTLDVRIDVDGRPRAVAMLFREKANPFKAGDAHRVTQAIPFLRRLFETPVGSLIPEESAPRGYLVLDAAANLILMRDAEAVALLQSCKVIGQGISLSGTTTRAPRFLRQLCADLPHRSSAATTIETGTGRLLAEARRIGSPDGLGPHQVLVSLELLTPKPLAIVEALLDLPLSPVQRSIALEAALNRRRADSVASTGVGQEAFKKHLATIYRTLGVNSWHDVAAALTPIPKAQVLAHV